MCVYKDFVAQKCAKALVRAKKRVRITSAQVSWIGGLGMVWSGRGLVGRRNGMADSDNIHVCILSLISY